MKAIWLSGTYYINSFLNIFRYIGTSYGPRKCSFSPCVVREMTPKVKPNKRIQSIFSSLFSFLGLWYEERKQIDTDVVWLSRAKFSPGMASFTWRDVFISSRSKCQTLLLHMFAQHVFTIKTSACRETMFQIWKTDLLERFQFSLLTTGFLHDRPTVFKEPFTAQVSEIDLNKCEHFLKANWDRCKQVWTLSQSKLRSI